MRLLSDQICRFCARRLTESASSLRAPSPCARVGHGVGVTRCKLR